MPYFLLLILAVSPSLIWLLFFLRKDVHPESNREIVKIFIYGMLAALPALLLQLAIFDFFGNLMPFFAKLFTAPWALFLFSTLNFVIWMALIEELLKYLVVKEKALTSPEFDEPVDVMLYMIIAALGFAALENILLFFPPESPFVVREALELSIFRLVGATFLHALCSGLFGYFLALSLCETKKRTRLALTGLGLAVLLHTLYNFSIMIAGKESIRLVIPGIIIISLAIIVSVQFTKIKKLASVCKIK